MQLKVLLKLSAANNRLPDNAFFAYRNIEIFDFIFKPRPGIKLWDDTFIEMANLNASEFTFAFD